jgi:molybdopterin converting factor small subunit
MPKVHVRLFADLREFAAGAAAVDVEIVPGDTIATTLARLGIASDRLRVVFLNARSVPLEHVLAGGEELFVFSAVGGG